MNSNSKLELVKLMVVSKEVGGCSYDVEDALQKYEADVILQKTSGEHTFICLKDRTGKLKGEK